MLAVGRGNVRPVVQTDAFRRFGDGAARLEALMRRLWDGEPSARPSAEEALTEVEAIARMALSPAELAGSTTGDAEVALGTGSAPVVTRASGMQSFLHAIGATTPTSRGSTADGAGMDPSGIALALSATRVQSLSRSGARAGGAVIDLTNGAAGRRPGPLTASTGGAGVGAGYL